MKVEVDSEKLKKEVLTIQEICKRFAKFWNIAANTAPWQDIRGFFLTAERQFWIVIEKLEDLKEVIDQEEVDAR